MIYVFVIFIVPVFVVGLLKVLLHFEDGLDKL